MTNKLYVWWKNHRTLIFFASSFLLFSFYLNPIVEESKYKNICIKLSEKGALEKFKQQNIAESLRSETSLSIMELAKIEGYKNCIK